MMNYPYYIYPGYPCAGYHDFETYNKNLIKLNKEILQLNSIEQPFLFHLTIGSAMEEDLVLNNKSNYAFQWQQLFPYHLQQHAKNGGKVIHFVVTPTHFFNIDRWITPTFLSHTPEYQWGCANDGQRNVIFSKVYDIKIIIFCTMVPTVDLRNNRIHKIILQNEQLQMYAPAILQTDYDVEFINSFYINLHNTINYINSIGGISTCFSFAVFCELTNKRHIRDYEMFKEIIKCYDKEILAEWTFFRGCHILNLKKEIDDINFFSYVDPASINNGYKNILTIKTNNDGHLFAMFSP